MKAFQVFLQAASIWLLLVTYVWNKCIEKYVQRQLGHRKEYFLASSVFCNTGFYGSFKTQEIAYALVANNFGNWDRAFIIKRAFCFLCSLQMSNFMFISVQFWMFETKCLRGILRLFAVKASKSFWRSSLFKSNQIKFTCQSNSTRSPKTINIRTMSVIGSINIKENRAPVGIQAILETGHCCWNWIEYLMEDYWR